MKNLLNTKRKLSDEESFMSNKNKDTNNKKINKDLDSLSNSDIEDYNQNKYTKITKSFDKFHKENKSKSEIKINNKEDISSNINKYTNKPYSSRYYDILKKRKILPAWESKKELFDLISKNQVLILKGETGSGKTTQIPQFLLEKFCSIAVTQPRRVAAMSVAQRVAQEMDVVLGEQVGYNIRFEDCTSDKTILKYMTDGMLLKEAMSDNTLSRYDLIVLDECHERTLATDILFGLMKEILPKRNNLKVIVMSATIDMTKFQQYFDSAPILNIPGRLFKVEIKYLNEPTDDYLKEAVELAADIHKNEPEGDILIFLTGEEEIEYACQMIRDEIDTNEDGYISVIPLYSTLPPYMQQRIFDPAPSKNKRNNKPGRKIVVSTNVAETSITIDGIVYVIDSGYSKQKVYNPRLRMESLLVSPISKANAKQRAGRAGRTKEGICYRLYTKYTYENELEKTSYPEILRSNMSNVVLTLLKLNIFDIVHFDFMDPPAPETMMRALELLHYLKAVNNDGRLTDEGKIIAQTPLEPELAKSLISSVKYKCVNEILTIVSMLSVPGVFIRNKSNSSSDDFKNKFAHPSGDHITLLIVYNAYKYYELEIGNKTKDINKELSTFSSKIINDPYSSNVESFCRNNFLNLRNLKNANNIRNQLQNMLESFGIIDTAKENKYSLEFKDKKIHKILKAMLTGCFSQVCHLESQGHYTTSKENNIVLLHPSSVLKFKPTWILYHDFVCTGRNYVRTLSKINPEWLFEVNEEYYNLEKFPNVNFKKYLIKVAKELEEEDIENESSNSQKIKYKNNLLIQESKIVKN